MLFSLIQGKYSLQFFCAIILIVARHLYGYTKILDGDGDPDRPDGYGPTQV